MLFIGCTMLTIFYLLRRSVKSIIANYDQEEVISYALNYPPEAGKPHYITATSSKRINIYSFFAVTIGYLMLVIGAFFFGGGLIL
ncbi:MULTISPECIES: hypothetical protein [Pantoea]|uniref:hypothetical protein n=1 Tax=Pantoea TaxID=53335 RepID=UPI0028937804|nr:hypothetical protein [Pantoea sp. UBA5923]